MAKQGEQGVDAVERALGILEAFADGTAKLGLTDLARRTGLYHSTILRLAVSLEKFGYLKRDADKQFRLGAAVMRLAASYQATFDLADHVRPILKAICEAAGETAAFYVRDGERRICLYRHNAVRMVRSHLNEGSETSLEVGASSRILKAYTDGAGSFYDEIRAHGCYVSLGEREPDIGGVAVPVFGAGKKLVGSLGVTGPLHRFTPDAVEQARLVLVEKAAELGSELGYRLIEA
jgi:DNA-binding IclR family transcriptional regulator